MDWVPALISLSQRRVFDRLFLTKHWRCFNTDTKGAEGAADLLQALSQLTQLENLDFNGCNQIPAAAWQKVRSAKWLNLKKADFTRCLAERNGWGVFWFSTCIYLSLSLLNVVRVQICIDLWSCLMSPSWPVWVSDGLGPALIAVSTSCFRQIVSDKTLQVLRHWHERSRGRRRSASSVESVDTAGKLGF